MKEVDELINAADQDVFKDKEKISRFRVLKVCFPLMSTTWWSILIQSGRKSNELMMS